MPPKSRITREMILEAAYDIARTQGAEQINARAVAAKLGCSTQPVLYHFDHVEDIRREVFRMANEYHGEFLMQSRPDDDPLLAMGLNYVRFAAQEKQLFRFLFQSDSFAGQSIADFIDAPEAAPMMAMFRKETGLSAEQTRRLFRTMMLLSHGCGSLLANNAMEYHEEEIAPMLETAFLSIFGAMQQEETK
ncbi:MAG: TetR/AcrR family transcriptional regulator [Clostridia bacterium]|nr:TetR/AcrR family transcriptional regulator [Clostridia bacterium]